MSDRTSWGARRVAGAAAGAAGLVAAGTALGLARRRRSIGHRVGARAGAGDRVPLGSLRSTPRTVVADDGVPLHVEIDEVEASHATGGADTGRTGPPLTLLFVHGYALTLDCWHFQRAAYRGLVRAVYYDQRSHGRSGRAPQGSATIDQLGRDLRRVMEEVVPEGPVVLVGHSMGGMTVVALAEQHPELFGDRVVGAALISTTAGGLDPHRMFLPFLPSAVGGDLARRFVAVLARGHRAVDGVRRLGRDVAVVATDVLAFGDRVPQSYVDFVDEMLAATPFEVLAEFFPNFDLLDKYDALGALAGIPTTVVCGTSDRLTSVTHSRTLHERIPGSTLVECEGAGHMVILERHDRVAASLDQLLAAASERATR